MRRNKQRGKKMPTTSQVALGLVMEATVPFF